MSTFVRRLAGRINRVIVPPSASPTEALKRLYQGKPAVLVKIGANDGVQGDPLRELMLANPQWNVLFIEPIKTIYERLKQNYPSVNHYRFENVAISNQRGTRPFYYVSDSIKVAIPDVPWWYDQLGSFDRNHIIKHYAAFEPFIIVENIQCETLPAVLEKHGLTSSIDMIHIDVEGYDYEILKQVDFSSRRLRAILYEDVHLSDDDNKAAEKLVRNAGYVLQRFDVDTLAVRNKMSTSYEAIRRLCFPTR